MHTLILPDGGELTWDASRIEKVGDRGLPETVIYHHSGNEKRPGLTLTITVADGVPWLTGVEFATTPGGAQIRAKEIKWGAVDLDRSITYWLAEVAYQPNEGGRRGHSWVKSYPVSAAERQAAAREVERGRRPTRLRKETPEFLREVAATYKTAATPKHEHVGRALDMNPRTAQRWIEKARAAGLLPPSERARKP